MARIATHQDEVNLESRTSNPLINKAKKATLARDMLIAGDLCGFGEMSPLASGNSGTWFGATCVRVHVAFLEHPQGTEKFMNSGNGKEALYGNYAVVVVFSTGGEKVVKVADMNVYNSYVTRTFVLGQTNEELFRQAFYNLYNQEFSETDYTSELYDIADETYFLVKGKDGDERTVNRLLMNSGIRQWWHSSPLLQ